MKTNILIILLIFCVLGLLFKASFDFVEKKLQSRAVIVLDKKEGEVNAQVKKESLDSLVRDNNQQLNKSPGN